MKDSLKIILWLFQKLVELVDDIMKNYFLILW
jgi:hypothetical protein